MTRFAPLLSAALAALLLLGCGSDNHRKGLTDQLVDTLKLTLEQRKNTGKPQAASLVTRAQAEASTLPLIRVTLGVTNSMATAAEFARNGDTGTYLMATNQAVYLRGGLMTGTRGLGFDLMSAGLPPRSVKALSRSGGHQRVHRYLNSENKLEKQVFSCTVSLGAPATLTQLERRYSVRRVTERCTGTSGSFENTYDMDPRTGQVWRSRQWVGPTAGYMVIEQLKA